MEPGKLLLVNGLKQYSVRAKPMEWKDISGDGYTAFQARNEFGLFSYGTDRDRKAYFQAQGVEEDFTTETEAKIAVEEFYQKLVFEKIAALTTLEPVSPSGPAPEVIVELQSLLAKYAADCLEARYWGGPTIYPPHPITEEVARRFGEQLASI